MPLSPPPTGTPAGPRRPRPAASLATRATELTVLNAFAVAQPMFALIGANPPFLAAHHAGASDVLVLVVVLLLAVPLAGMGLEALVDRIAPRAGAATHRVLVALLVAFGLYPLLRRWTGENEAVALAGALVAASGFAVLHRRSSGIRSFLRFLAPVPIVFAGVFLWSDGVRSLLARSDVPEPPPAVARDGGALSSVVFLLLDELPLYVLLDRERQIDARLFPSFARLAQRSIWFRNATAMNPMTATVVPAILTGHVPGAPTQGFLRQSPNNLFTWLARSHRLVVHEAVTGLCPPAACEPLPGLRKRDRVGLLRDVAVLLAGWGLPRAFVPTLGAPEAQWTGFGGGTSVRARAIEVERFIDSIGADTRPTLHFLHVLLPHIPWTGLPSGSIYPALATPGDLLPRSREPWPAALAFQRHLLQVGFVDRLVGALLDRLDDTGTFDRTTLIVTADHGVAFQPGEHRRRLGDANLRDVIHVPLFVKPPFLAAGRVSDRNVESIDVLPTIASALGVTLPFPVDGVSALDERIPPRPTKHPADEDRQWTLDPALPASWWGWRRKAELFGPEPTWRDVYALSSDPALLGRPIDEATLTDLPDVSYGIVAGEHLTRVATARDRVPSYVWGIVWAATVEALPDQVALAVDGTIVGVGRLFQKLAPRAIPFGVTDDRASGSFAMMVPENTFGRGNHRVELFAVTAERGLARMTPEPVPERAALRPGFPDR